MTMDKRKMCDQALVEFDFDKAARVYELLDWKWVETPAHPAGVPDAATIRATAEGLCDRFCAKEDCLGIATGGLRVALDPLDEGGPSVELLFVAVKGESKWGQFFEEAGT